MSIRRTVAALITAGGLTAAAVLAAPTSAEAVGGSKLKIVKVQFDTPGTDLPVTNARLNAEFVQIKNTDKVTRSLTGWTLYDNSNHVYTFGSTKLAAGRILTVRTGSGTDKGGLRFWNSGYYIWNNTTDTAHLRNTTGGGGSTCAWKTSTPGNSLLCNQ